MLDLIKFKLVGINEDSINFDCFEKYTSPNKIEYKLDDNILKQLIGITEMTYNNHQELITTISGKFLARKGYLGGITNKNYGEIIKKLNSTEILKLEGICEKDMQLLRVDYTKDVQVTDIQKTLFALQEYLRKSSNKYRQIIYDGETVMVKPYAKSRKTSLTFYSKYKDLSKAKFKEYIELIGYNTYENTKNILRVERHLYNFKEIREAFDINKKGNIYLSDILESKSNPILKMFDVLNLKEDFIL